MAKKGMLNMVGGIAGLVGVTIALLLGAFEGVSAWIIPVWLWTILIFAGLAIGLLNITRKETVGFMVSVIILVLLGLSGVVAPFPAMIGDVVNSMGSALLAVMFPAGVVVGIKTMITMARKK